MNLPDWMHATLLGNSLRDWIEALAWGVGATVVVVLGRGLASRRLDALASRTDTGAGRALVEAARSLRKTYVLIIAFGVALLELDFPRPAERTIRFVVVLVAAIQAIRIGSRLVDYWVSSYAIRRDNLDRTTLRALTYTGRVILWVAVVLLALDASGFAVRTLLTGLGISGIAVALAVQNILGDLFAALSIVLDKPFVVGDAIAVDQFEGDVVTIGLKSTRVRSVNGEEVVFSNADLLKSRLRNLSRRETRRYVITLILEPGTTAEQAARVPSLVAEAVAADGRASFVRSHVKAIGATGIEVESAVIVKGNDFLAALDIRQAVLLGILERMEREKIELAGSTFVVHGGTGTSA